MDVQKMFRNNKYGISAKILLLLTFSAKEPSNVLVICNNPQLRKNHTVALFLTSIPLLELEPLDVLLRHFNK